MFLFLCLNENDFMSFVFPNRLVTPPNPSLQSHTCLLVVDHKLKTKSKGHPNYNLPLCAPFRSCLACRSHTLSSGRPVLLPMSETLRHEADLTSLRLCILMALSWRIAAGKQCLKSTYLKRERKVTLFASVSAAAVSVSAPPH